MRVSIQPACLRDATWIAANARHQDRREIECAPLPAATMTEAVYGLLCGSDGHAFIAYADADEPVAVIGVVRLSPWYGSAWAFGTAKTRRVIPALTRWGVETWKPRLIADGYRRVEVRTIADHDLSHRWLERLGFVREGVCSGYGRDGQDFVQYAYVR